ncbi:arylsulfatase [uncultured Polaribacter sp.]|uniref:sulfatase family protein n=1 Tax=uncultured Polaribacter sp. TaxID=174711 RepID=UPI0026205FAD|nr:arylsulfatase [uncultured Polaribacter sp.]
MNRKKNIGSVFLFTMFFAVIGYSQRNSNTLKNNRPNIIIIYTDDQGHGDVSALNTDAKFKTPNMDRLASEGITFTNGHSASSVCTPSRYSLLTGRYPWRTKLKKGVFRAEATCLIEDDRVTIASFLKNQGYNTAMVGKWHLGMDFPNTKANRDWSQPIKDMPLDKGFDYFYGIPASLNFGILAWFEGRYAKVPPTLYSNKKKNERHVDYRIMPPYDNTAEETKSKLGRVGFEIAPDFIDNQCLTRFTDKAIAWMKTKESDAQENKPFFLYLPYTSPHYPVAPLPEFHGQGEAGAYGEFVIETDYHIGRILNYLEKSGLDENTLIVFTSDNGPEKSWSGRIKEFNHDSRGGFKEGKRSVYEGGHRVPFLLRWPSGIKKSGRQWNKPVGQIDLLATISELVDVELSDSSGEDSQSFASVLLNPNHDYQRLPLINRGDGGKEQRYSITENDWKLILPSATKAAELYDLSQDPKETNNIANNHPDKIDRLTNQINNIIINGRTTPGKNQPNDTGYWDDLTWISKQEYQTRIKTN